MYILNLVFNAISLEGHYLELYNVVCQKDSQEISFACEIGPGFHLAY